MCAKVQHLSPKLFRCSNCRETFPNRRDLYHHRVTQHGGAEVNALQQEVELVNPPWLNKQGEVIDESLQRVYDNNRLHILAPHTEGEGVRNYNFPTDDLRGGVDEIMNRVENIYQTENNSFKLNLNLGFIMRNRETGEYRYFIPYANSYLLHSPQTITDRASLRRLRRKLEDLNPVEYIMTHRPDSRWEPVFITNLKLDIFSMDYPLGKGVDLPKHVTECKSLFTLLKHQDKKPHNDNLCFFRCLAWEQLKSYSGLDILTHQKYRDWLEYKGLETPRKFPGLQLDDFPELENCFQTNLNVFQLLENRAVTVHYKSMSYFDQTVYLDMQDGHLSYIKNFDSYAKRYQCPTCSRMFKRFPVLKKHLRHCSKLTKLKFPGGFYQAKQTVFDELEKFGIFVAGEDRFFPYFITYDFESILQRQQNRGTNKLRWDEKHIPISVGVGSNVPGHEKGVCFVNADLDELLDEMLTEMHKIAKKVKHIQKIKFEHVIDRLIGLRDQYKDREHSAEVDPSRAASEVEEVNDFEPPSKKFKKRIGVENTFRGMLQRLEETGQMRAQYHDFTSDDSDESNCEQEEEEEGDLCTNERGSLRNEGRNQKCRKTMYKKLDTLLGRFKSYCRCVPVLGFNSAKYDLNLVKSKLCSHLDLTRPECFTVKKSNAYVTISTPSLKFLDISHYIAPGYSYAQFLKSYKASEEKGFFCYQYLSDPTVLEETRLPPYEAFYSSLKRINVLEEEISRWQKIHSISLSTQDSEYHRYTGSYKSKYVSAYSDVPVSICSYCEKAKCICEGKPKSGWRNYLDLKKLWAKQNMTTLKDFLIYYNLKDIDPFTEAVKNLQKFYRKNRVDLFKDTISVPGAARQMLFNTDKAKFALFNSQNEDLFRKIKQNICGGPSIVFTRHMREGQTLKNGDQVCQKIFGFDANALYPYCLRQEMPCGTFVRRKKDKNFKPEIQDKYLDMFVWMDQVSEVLNIKIAHKMNSGKEHYVMGYYVDGIHENHIYSYHGCYHHGCRSCTEKVKEKKSAQFLRQQKTKYDRTVSRREYLEKLGYVVHEIWECQFNAVFRPYTQSIRDNYMPPYYRVHKWGLKMDTLLKAIQSGELFGMAEVDIRVPNKWTGAFQPDLPPHQYYSEFSPIFCTTHIPEEVIGERMKEHCREQGFKIGKRRLLVGGMKAERIMLSTPLLCWYLQHGLEVTDLHEVIEFSPIRCFSGFVEKCISARREADLHSDLSLQGDTYKTLINSAYGSTLLDKEKFCNTSYLKGHSSFKLAVNNPGFRKATHLVNEMYEVESAKNSITMDIPIQIGFFILNYAKLRMLQFYYDCLCKYIDRSKFECIQMDTDSLYFGLAAKNLSEAVTDNLRGEFIEKLEGRCGCIHKADAETFFPRTVCTLVWLPKT